uniref:TMV resistance protein N n=1 Tax=Solanum tuberosum TaxID=4113 RepID=M1BDK1_SOLTU
MENMKRLTILYINGFDTHDDSIEYLPNSLCWFECHKYPWESLPETFEPKRLVHLYLHLSFMDWNKAFAVSAKAKSLSLQKAEANTRFHRDAKFGVFGFGMVL